MQLNPTSKTKTMLIKVLLPLAIPRSYTYSVPEELQSQIAFGIRVEIPLRRKLYSGIVTHLHANAEDLVNPKPIISIMDTQPIVTENQLKLWQWMADYYCCTIGQVMNIAIPSGLKLHSETRVSPLQKLDEHLVNLTNDNEFMIAEAILNNGEISIDEIAKVLGKKSVYPTIKSLLDQGLIITGEYLIEKYKPKTQDFIKFAEEYRSKVKSMDDALNLTSKSEKQTQTLLALMTLSPSLDWVDKGDLYKKVTTDSSVINALVKKGIVIKEKFEVSRITPSETEVDALPPMSEAQSQAHQKVMSYFEEGKNVLLFGVTGSGKTRIYTEIIKEVIERGEQVLFLLPEIALTTQLVQRLTVTFGSDVGVYHSRLDQHRRVELYKSALEGNPIFIGARSSIFLPFKKLGLIVVDEEHDPSYKQSDPAPRYQGRDTALYLSQLTGAKVILGSATPSMETYLNGINGKLGVVNLIHRYGEAVLPDIEIVDLKYQHENKKMRSMFSSPLLYAMKEALAAGEQILLFQNRRGYSPTLQCGVCEWNAGCPNCDVSLTTHKYYDELRCHYCGYRHKTPQECPACGSVKLSKLGFGTEKIEDELGKYLKEAKIARLDYDTAKTRAQFESLIYDFEHQNIDILIGTQMITKGLDFDNIGLVGVLLADKIMNFPDFRANERAFQLFTQVAGRAGRRKKKGKVIIQTYNPSHAVIQETLKVDYAGYYKRELSEREEFKYPPYYRQITLTLKHKVQDRCIQVADFLSERLKAHLGSRVIGPAVPSIPRIRNQYITLITIKMEQDWDVIRKIKEIVKTEIHNVKSQKNASTVRININVDP